MMLSDKNVIINLALDHCDGEGDWLITDTESHIGEDVE